MTVELHKDVPNPTMRLSAEFIAKTSCNPRFAHQISEYWLLEQPQDLPARISDKGAIVSSFRSQGENLDQRLYDESDGLVLLMRGQKSVHCSIASSTDEQAHKLLERCKTILPEAEIGEGSVIMKFWYLIQGQGPSWVDRKISVSDWVDIRDNYGMDVRERMDHLVGKEFEPGVGGQLILWEGEPGTGKTHALRALTRSWNDWARLNFVTDPENFFGDSAYMTQVLTMMDGADEKWNVLILEDAGELLSRDAKERTGQAVSRLLNLVDGLIGQGLKILVLVTTNEPVKGFHEAIARPGRCAVHIPFERLEHEEVVEWLATHDMDPEEAFPGMTLADLYGLLNHTEGAKQQKHAFGFSS